MLASHQGGFRVAEMFGQEVGVAVDAQVVEIGHLFTGNLRGIREAEPAWSLGLAAVALALAMLNLGGWRDLPPDRYGEGDYTCL